MSYYITYVLGYQQKTGKKALLGTITHKVMEVLANCKKQIQESPKKKKYIFIDDELGNIKYDYQTLMSGEFVELLLDLSYKHYTSHAGHLTFNHDEDMQFCRNMVDAGINENEGKFDPRNQNIFVAEQPFEFVLNNEWAKYQVNGEDYYLTVRGTMDLIVKEDEETLHLVDYKGLSLDTKIPTINGWTTMKDVKVGDVLYDMYNNPTKVIGKSEVKNLPCYKLSFRSSIGESESIVCDNEHLWRMVNGEVKPVTSIIAGDLLPYKGDELNKNWIVTNIEQVDSVPTQCIKVDSSTNTFLCGTNMIPTHNTGQRLDWATGEKKDMPKLQKDFQLMLYYYAIKKLFPEYKKVIVTIIFLRDGGPFTLEFEDSTVEKVEELFKEHFETVKKNTFPKPVSQNRSSFKCNRLCDFYKETWEGTKKPICNHVEDTIALYGIENATNKLRKKDFSVGFYKKPGSKD